MDDDELTPEQKFAAESPETMVPRALLAGRDPEDIIPELIRLGWSAGAARALVNRIKDDLRRYHESPEARTQLRREALAQLTCGLLLALLGAVVTAFTVLAALAGALPFFVVAVGQFLAGRIHAGPGWARWRL